jgi:hypothetical protein
MWEKGRGLNTYYCKNDFTPFSTQFHPSQLVVTVLYHHCICPMDSVEAKVEWRASSETQPHCFLTQCTLNLGASPTNVSEETPYTWQPCQLACARACATGVGQGYPGRPNPPLTRTMLGQLFVASWVSRSRMATTQHDIKPGTVVTQLALRCSALDHCITREVTVYIFDIEIADFRHFIF